jgi:hypothetical protein
MGATMNTARTITAIAMLLAAALVLTACSDTVSDEALETVSERCKAVSQETLDFIATGLTIENGTLRDGAGVKSDYGPDLWMVAAELDGVGFEGDGDLAVWALITGLEVDQIEAIAAADDFTREASTWGDDLGSDISSLVDGVSASLACVGLNQDNS